LLKINSICHLLAEMTLAAALEISSRRTLFFFWDDVSNFDVFEKLAVSALNNVLYWWCIG
jgi:hypothetical protein